MGRIRTIKPQFFLNEALATLHPLDRILFIGLLTLADREGRLEDRPGRIKVQVLPYDEHDVHEALNRLDQNEERFIMRYELPEGKFIQIINFTKHQHCNSKEPNSTIPAPAGHVPAPEEHGKARVEGKGKEGKGTGREGKGTGEIPAREKFVLPDWIPAEWWEAFEEMREKIKRPMTNRAREMIVEKLDAFRKKGYDPIDALKHSVEMGWQGVFEPKTGGKHGPGKLFEEQREQYDKTKYSDALGTGKE